MEPRWDRFIKKYQNQLPRLPLRTILEAFFYYLDGSEKAEEEVIADGLKQQEK